MKGLVKQNFDITVIDFYPQQKGYWREELQKLGVRLISYESQSKIDRIPRLIKDLVGIRPHIVHGWNFHTNPYANICGWLARVPIRIGSVREHPKYWPNSSLLALNAIYGLNGLIFNSVTAYSFYKDQLHWPLKFLAPKGYVILNGSEVQQNEDKNRLTNELVASSISLPSNRNVLRIVGIGRLNENKNWSLLIKSCEYLLRHGKDFVSIIFGDGPEKNNLVNQIKEANLEGKILLAGSIPNASKYLPLFDLLCSCSNSEGLPNSVMEASLAGLPVLATKVGGTEEIIKNNETGILVNSGDLNEFQQKLYYLALSNEERIMMGAAGKARIESQFNAVLMVKRMIEVYYDLINKTDQAKHASPIF